MKKVLLIDNDSVYEVSRNKIYKNKKLFIEVDNVLLKFNYSTLLSRLLRMKIHNLIVHNNQYIVLIKNFFLFYDKNGVFLSSVPIDKGSRPLQNGIVVVNNIMYYGDYWSNKHNEDVNIYRVDLKSYKKTIFYTFNFVRHIHLIQIDKSNKEYLYVGTGDKNDESGIFHLNITTREIKVIGSGTQKFRAVSLIESLNKIYWGSDDPDGENYIYSYNQKNKELKSLKKIEGPAYYSTVDKNGYFYIATTIEDRNMHKAIIYRSIDDGYSWHVFKEFKKDIWHTKYFGYGVIEFVNNQEQLEKLYYNLAGLKEMN